ncbi:hypothetical protein ACVWWG_004750 [Bradyrhizobium sp. LB7.2]
MSGRMKIKAAATSLCVFAGCWLQAYAATAGECVSRPERFELASDTVYWTVSIPSGTECLQGLRGKTQLLNEVKLVDAAECRRRDDRRPVVSLPSVLEPWN